jgi:exodeoxyribonuclease VII small subunit
MTARSRVTSSTSAVVAGRTEMSGTWGDATLETLGPDPRLARVADVPDLQTLSYEQAREELVDVVRTLEAGGTTLEESLALWERGEALAARCQEWLDGARATLDAAIAKDRGTDAGDAGDADGDAEADDD